MYREDLTGIPTRNKLNTLCNYLKKYKRNNGYHVIITDYMAYSSTCYMSEDSSQKLTKGDTV